MVDAFDNTIINYRITQPFERSFLMWKEKISFLLNDQDKKDSSLRRSYRFERHVLVEHIFIQTISIYEKKNSTTILECRDIHQSFSHEKYALFIIILLFAFSTKDDISLCIKIDVTLQIYHMRL